MSDLREAAQAVLDRWDSPAWEWQKQGPTADLMAELRAALAQEQANGSWHDGVLEGQLRERERWLAQEQAEPVCKCDLRTRLVGDGCEVCNPELAAEFAQAEPVAWGWRGADGMIRDCIAPDTHAEQAGKYTVPFYAAPVQEQAEPVAWLDAEMSQAYTADELADASGTSFLPLYTAPPQRPPLTDEEIKVMWDSHRAALPRYLCFARAIERKVRGGE